MAESSKIALGFLAFFGVGYLLGKEGKKLNEAILALTAEVAREKDVIASAKKLFQQLADIIASNATNPQALLDLAATLKAQDDDLANAVATFTPPPTTTPAPTV